MHRRHECPWRSRRDRVLRDWRRRWQTEDATFGKPEWFRILPTGRIIPAGWPAWLYGAVWSLVIAIPFSTLVLRHRLPEAMIWLAASIVMVTWDVRQISRALQRSPWHRDELPSD